MAKKLSRIGMALLAVLLVAGLVIGCGGNAATEGEEQNQQGGSEELSGMLQVNGSTTVAPVGQAWAEKFNEKHPNVDVVVSGTGSGDGIAALINGTTDIAMASRKMKDKERDRIDGTPKEIVVGRDGLAVVVHPDNPVDSLSMAEIKDIFTGQITNWQEVGGEDAEIIVYTRDTSSGTYGFFKEFVLDDQDYLKSGRATASNAAIANSVAGEETAIGYCGLAFLDDKIKGISVSKDGGEPVEPTLEKAKAGEYPIVRDLNMYTIGEPEGLAKDFLDYGFSYAGQAIVEEVGYLPVE
ncbi:MAG: phosphate ABC transporter substrate-binding protein [Firmicutes bacterium]|nr:phosphate ABC transporter substrate-binding protein [Bacillota bacterium]